MLRQATRPIARLASLCVVAVGFVALEGTASSEDRVVLAPAKGSGPKTTLRGEILDYRGDSLRLRLTNGKEETFDSARVIELQTNWPAGLARGETAWRRGEWEGAIAAYREAATSDSRAWVRRRVLARMIEALRDARRIADAGDAFLALHRADSSTPYFHVIPLDWTVTGPDAESVETRAREWLKNDAVAPAVLLGASWLLSRDARPEAQAALRRLLSEKDPRIVHLAGAQLWRTRVAAAVDDDVARWRAQLERMPDELRPGPTFILGLVDSRRDDAPTAALEFLRIPILWSDHRELAARSLWEASRQLDRAERDAEAAQLAREIVVQYPHSAAAPAAQARLDQLGANPTGDAARPETRPASTR